MVDELQRAVPFDFIGVSLFARRNSDTFQNYSTDIQVERKRNLFRHLRDGIRVRQVVSLASCSRTK
jgi:hypothetical protein